MATGQRRSKADRPCTTQGREPKVLRGWLTLACGVLTLLLLPGVGRADEPVDLEPVPPVLLMRTPDPVTETEILDLINNSFADRVKTPRARAQLIHRYHMWSVPALVGELKAPGANESGMWNSILTLAGHRDTHGPAPELRSALRPLRAMLDTPEPYRKAFAALALGCWHHPEADTPDAPGMDPLRSDDAAGVRRAMSENVLKLRTLLYDGHPHVRVASNLALAKRGGGLREARSWMA